jgi:hypothetical protein
MAKRPKCVSDGTLKLEAADDGYVLCRGKLNFALSDQDIIDLAQTIPALRDRVLSRFSRAGSVEPVVVTPVAEVGLNTDVLGENLILTLGVPSGAEIRYSLPLPQADFLVDRIPAHVARARAQKASH